MEVKNYRNQKFTSKDIGKNKARVLGNRFSKLGISVEYIDRYIKSKEDLVQILKGIKNKILLVGCVDNNKARRYMHEAFYSEEIPTLLYVDTGNGDGENREGQTVLGAKQDNQVVKPPVGDMYPNILFEEEEVEEKVSFQCSQIQEHPQHFATNVFSATVTFLMINNVVSLGKIANPFVRFDSDTICIK